MGSNTRITPYIHGQSVCIAEGWWSITGGEKGKNGLKHRSRPVIKVSYLKTYRACQQVRHKANEGGNVITITRKIALPIPCILGGVLEVISYEHGVYGFTGHVHL